MDGDTHHAGACCGACAYAAEVAKNGGPVPNTNEPLRVALDERGVPRDVTLVMKPLYSDPWTVRVEKPYLVLGRTPPADVVIAMGVLSRRQCALDFTTGEVVLEDLDSTCGTFINGAFIRREVVRAGDELRVGDLVIHVQIG